MDSKRTTGRIDLENNYRYLNNFFNEYTASFMGRDEFTDENISLKIYHTHRVVNIAEEISGYISNSYETQLLSITAALLHDIGRFEQFHTYKTFNDAHSENHALLGLKIIEDKKLLRDYENTSKNIILDAIRSHNMKDLPPNLSPESETVAKVVRDADKLDIMRVLCDYYPTREKKKNEGLEVNLPDTEGYTESIIEDIYAHKTIDNSKRNNYNDMKLVHLAWIFDLNYDQSLSIYKSKGYHKTIFKYLPDDEEIHELYNYIEKYLSDY